MSAIESTALDGDGPAVFGPTVGGETPVTIDVTVDGPGGSAPGNLSLNTVEGEGSYYDHGGDLIAVPYRPVQPLGDYVLPPGIAPRGFLITGLLVREWNGRGRIDQPRPGPHRSGARAGQSPVQG